jgi:hypothetical protein
LCQRTDENDCLERYECLLTPKKIQVVGLCKLSCITVNIYLINKLDTAKAYNKRRILFNIKRSVEELFMLVMCGELEDASDMRTTWNVAHAGPCMANISPALHF